MTTPFFRETKTCYSIWELPWSSLVLNLHIPLREHEFAFHSLLLFIITFRLTGRCVRVWKLYIFDYISCLFIQRRMFHNTRESCWNAEICTGIYMKTGSHSEENNKDKMACVCFASPGFSLLTSPEKQTWQRQNNNNTGCKSTRSPGIMIWTLHSCHKIPVPPLWWRLHSPL